MKVLNELQLAKELIKFPSITPVDAGVMKFLEKKLKKLVDISSGSSSTSLTSNRSPDVKKTKQKKAKKKDFKQIISRFCLIQMFLMKITHLKTIERNL